MESEAARTDISLIKFYAARVLNDVALTVAANETLGIVGESGCGKTVTSLSILRLVPEPPGHILPGSVIEFEGRTVAFTHPLQAMNAGLVTVFQEFNLLPERTVAQNVFLGREPRAAGFIDKKGMDMMEDGLRWRAAGRRKSLGGAGIGRARRPAPGRWVPACSGL